MQLKPQKIATILLFLVIGILTTDIICFRCGIHTVSSASIKLFSIRNAGCGLCQLYL